MKLYKFQVSKSVIHRMLIALCFHHPVKFPSATFILDPLYPYLQHILIDPCLYSSAIVNFVKQYVHRNGWGVRSK